MITIVKEEANVEDTLVEDHSLFAFVDLGAQKNMTGNLKYLNDFVEKFMGTVKLEMYQNYTISLAMEIWLKVILMLTSHRKRRSKDETPGVLIDFLTLVQRGLHAQVTTVRTDKGMEFLNKTLHAYFAQEGIRHETSTAPVTTAVYELFIRYNERCRISGTISLRTSKGEVYAIPTRWIVDPYHLTRFPSSRKHYMVSNKHQERGMMNSQLPSYPNGFSKIRIDAGCLDSRYHFIKEQVEKGIVELFFVGTEYQLADLFTKALSEDRFKYLVRRLGMRCLTLDELEVLAIESA
ncbi:retrovirus-related pol polyprotein from transposon TNT 1-94 [Tanacetum coccineum]